MGHNLFPTLPMTRRWSEVVSLIGAGAAIDEVAAAAGRAAERQLENAHRDPVYREAVELLFRIPLAAKQPDFARSLRDIGLPVGDAPDLTDIAFAAGDRLDRVAQETRKDGDFGEIARRALISSLTSRLGAELPGLLEATAEDVALAARRFASPRVFTGLARSFYSRLVSETLSSFLDRVLAAHIGPEQRFEDVGARARFDEALQLHAFETTRIIHEFGAGWHGKHVAAHNEARSSDLATFGYSALVKILAELKRRERDG